MDLAIKMLLLLVLFFVNSTFCNENLNEDEEISFERNHQTLNLLYFSDILLLVSRCPSGDREQMYRCEFDARDDWNVVDTDFYTSTRKFCCFVWDTLSCQVAIAKRCDPHYAAQLSQTTDNAYYSMCEYHGRASASCALRWWSIALIVLAGLGVIVGLVGLLCWCKKTRRNRKADVSTRPKTVEY